MKRIISTSVLCLTIGLVAAGCSGSDDTAAAGTSDTQAQGGGQAQAAGGRSPGGSGEVAAVSGSTAQVKGQDSQVAVSWTDSTTFTQQVAGTAADVTVGSCVTVTSADTSSSSTDTVAAATVRVTEATDGSCSVVGGGGGPQRDGARPTDLPTDLPSGAPDGAQGGGRRGGFATGEVTAVTDSGFTVSSVQPGADTSAATTVTVTTSDATTYTTTAAATADDVAVGSCVTSRGDADDTGAITATSITISQPVDGACTSGFGGFGGGRPADAS